MSFPFLDAASRHGKLFLNRPEFDVPMRQLSFVLAFALTSPATAGDGDGDAYFETRIRPVLVANCYPCHSAAAGKSKGGLRLDTRDSVRWRRARPGHCAQQARRQSADSSDSLRRRPENAARRQTTRRRDRRLRSMGDIRRRRPAPPGEFQCGGARLVGIPAVAPDRRPRNRRLPSTHFCYSDSRKRAGRSLHPPIRGH